MNIETVFTLANSFAPVCWLLLLFAPRWRVTRVAILSGLVPALYGVVYVILMVLYFGQSEGNFNSLGGVMKLFQQPEAVTAGWIHYLAFDLFVGAWVVANSQKNGIPHRWIVPCLVLSFLFGPAGLLVYFAVRVLYTKKVVHENF
ncbi:MAG: ABA4-like family protein [Cyclobacteriaceae bacterium]|jgi:hypothetical protein|nr:ABA4-like family protein [Cyclobacteriaceae bacterium]